MEEHTESLAESRWNLFWHSGRITDYLDYKSAVEHPGTPDKEQHHADSDQRAGSAGTQTG